MDMSDAKSIGDGVNARGCSKGFLDSPDFS